MTCPHGNTIRKACTRCVSADDDAENERLRGLLKEVLDHGRRATVVLGPEARDLLTRIDAVLEVERE